MKMNIRFLIASLLFANVLCSELTFSQENFQPVDTSITIGTLENGLTYFIKDNPHPANRVELRLVVKAGSILEDQDQLGVAHLVEHMAFNGSENFEKNQLIKYLESVGNKFGADLNAYTSFDETVYNLQVRTDIENQLDKGLLVLSDWAGGLSFDPMEIDKERGVVIAEWRNKLSADQRIRNQVLPVIYKDSKYAERLPIGKPKIIEDVSYEAINRFYRDWYRPDLMAIVVVGDIDKEILEEKIIKLFSKLKNPDPLREKPIYDIPKNEKTLISIATDPESFIGKIEVYIKHPSNRKINKQSIKTTMMVNLIVDLFNNRFEANSTQADPSFSNGYCWYGKDVGDNDLFYFTGTSNETETLNALEGMQIQMQQASKYGFLDFELDRVKTNRMKQIEIYEAEKERQESSNLVFPIVNHFLNNTPILEPTQTLLLHKELFPSIQTKDINQLVVKLLTNKNQINVISGPEHLKTSNLTKNTVLEMLELVPSKLQEPILQDISNEPLIKPLPKKGTVIAEEQNDLLGLDILTLSNGAKLYLKKTDFEQNQVHFSALSLGGYSSYPKEDFPNTDYAAGIAEATGVGQFSRTQLEQKLTGNTAFITGFIDDQMEGIKGACSNDDIETLFQLAHLKFTTFRKDTIAFENYMKDEHSIYDNLLADPYYYFWDQVSVIQFNNHYRAPYYTTKDLNKVNLNSCSKIYLERFSDADDFAFVLIGSFDKEEVKALAETYIASLPSKQEKEKIGDLGMKYENGIIQKTLTKGREPKSYLSMCFHGDFIYSTFNRYALKILTDILKIKLRESLREDQGGVYDVDISYESYKFPKNEYSISIEFNTDPEKMQELIKLTLSEIEKIKKEYVAEVYLANVKETLIQNSLKRKDTNDFWISNLPRLIVNDNPIDLMDQKVYTKEISKFTLEDIQKAANLFFNENYIEVVMNPE